MARTSPLNSATDGLAKQINDSLDAGKSKGYPSRVKFEQKKKDVRAEEMKRMNVTASGAIRNFLSTKKTESE